MNTKRTIYSICLVIALIMCGSNALAYYMPDFWYYQATPHIIYFKDLNDAPGGDHTSLDYIANLGLLCPTLYGYEQEYVIRHDDGTIYDRIKIVSLLRNTATHIIDRVDYGPNYSADSWYPYKKISALNWNIGDSINQTLGHKSYTYSNICILQFVYDLTFADNWTLVGSMSSLTNYFKDGSSKTWNGTILQVRETEANGLCGPNNIIDYWLLQNYGIIRMKMHIGTSSPCFSVGAY